MGILYDVFGSTKKRCTMCGCLMDDDHDGDMCEVCQDERGGTIPDSLREEDNKQC